MVLALRKALRAEPLLTIQPFRLSWTAFHPRQVANARASVLLYRKDHENRYLYFKPAPSDSHQWIFSRALLLLSERDLVRFRP